MDVLLRMVLARVVSRARVAAMTVRHLCARAVVPLVVSGGFLLSGATASAQGLPTALREVAYQHAPIVLAEQYRGRAGDNGYAADHILPVDFDGDLSGANNAQNAKNRWPVIDSRPTVYFSIVETATNYYIGYYFYHPYQDIGCIRSIAGCLGTDPHEHDLEGVWLVVRKTRFHPYGLLVGALTQAHDALIPALAHNGGYTWASAAVGHYGYINYWMHPSSGTYHPVVAIRAVTHGTFMAQDFTDQTLPQVLYSDGFGIDPTSPQVSGTYRTVIHDDSYGMIYTPGEFSCAPSTGSCVQGLPSNAKDGVHRYRLVEVAASQLWSQRSTSGSAALYVGPWADMGGGLSGPANFHPSSGQAAKARPMWRWEGGAGQTKLIFGAHNHWYTFAHDMTDVSQSPMWWPTIPPGALLNQPALAASTFFPSETLNGAPVYVPYGWGATPGNPPSDPEPCEPVPPQIACAS